MTARSEYIQALLDAARPTKVYSDNAWITAAHIPQKIRDWDLQHGTIDQALLASAERDANRLEGQSSKSANRALRRWLTDEAPLDWSLLGALPVKIDAKRKCRYDSITPDLVEDAADFTEAQGRRVYGEVLLLVDALRVLARAARRAGVTVVTALGDEVEDIDRSRWRRQPPLPGIEDDVDDDDDT